MATFSQDDKIYLAAGGEDRFCCAEVFFGVDADGVRRGWGYVDIDAVVEEAELLEAFDLFEPGGREGGEFFEGGFAVGVDAEVFAIACEAGVIAIEGDGGTGEVEGSAVAGGDDFDCAGVVDIVRRAADGEGGDLDFGAGEQVQHRGEVVWGEEGLVALDVDIDVGGDGLGDGPDAVSAAGAIFGSKDGGERVGLGEVEDLVGVSGDEDLVEEGAGAGGAIDPGDHGLAGNFAEDFAGQARGAEARGNDGENVAEGGGQRGTSGIV